MRNKIQSANDSSRALPGPLRLSVLLVLLYLLISLILLSLLNIRVIWHSLLNYTIGSNSQADLAPLTDNLVNFLDKLNTPVLMIFWAGFGALVYGVIWFIQNVVFTIEKEVEESRYLQGGITPIRDYWHRVLVSDVWLAGAVVFWVTYMIIFLSWLLPDFSKLFFDAFYEHGTFRQIADIGGAVVLNAAGLYAFWSLHYLVNYARRVSDN